MGGSTTIPPHLLDAQPMALESLPESFYADLLSDVAKSRRPSPIRSLFPLENTPGILSLLAGKPNPTSFPFTGLTFTARPPPNANGELALEDNAISLPSADLQAALQYGPTAGLPALIEWLYELQQVVHGRGKGEGWSLMIGNGSQDLLSKAVVALFNPGDTVLVQSPVYAGVIPVFQSAKCDQIEVETDADGVSTDALRSILENWLNNKKKPRVLYTIPYGGNPTGATTTVERRREVLALAREHDFIILEDDPYHYLYFGPAESRPPSYFALECSGGHPVGRVLRMDSVSKVLSAGLRIGFASGPTPLLRAIEAHTGITNLQPPGITQAILLALLTSREWGHAGFLRHVSQVSDFYKAKRDVFEAALRRHLGDVVEWSTPQSGLFFWFRLRQEDDSEAFVRTKAFERGVLALPGSVFLPDGRKTGYVRAAFSLLGEEEVDEALRRLALAVRDAAVS
ncbi:Aminotran-1-2 domain-containing protein [Mycena chlorophos]|uniref:Aminotran-1-2 domain-containing protein n=1 Tax=Mycena chlorophos TaxID=658473 RepID=A0A8H6RZ48_MYCCL|nr:Aminotran-1-2 domain-containing protein [Mycena chlorophos]